MFAGGRGAVHDARGQDPRATRARPAQVHRLRGRVRRPGVQLAGLPQRRHAGRHIRSVAGVNMRIALVHMPP